jgi:hypothetical protein
MGRPFRLGTVDLVEAKMLLTLLRKHSGLRRWSTVFVMAAVITLATAQNAYAIGCTYNSCDGKGPVSMGCDKAGASTKDDRTTLGVRYRLIWSSGCHAGWVKGTGPTGHALPKRVQIEEQKWFSGQQTWQTVALQYVWLDNEETDWSNMLGGAGYYRICYDERPLGSSTYVCGGRRYLS